MNNRFAEYKELLSVLPRNNIKNSKVYYEKAIKIREEALEYKEKLLLEINKRVKKIESKEEISNKYEEELKKYKENTRILNEYNSCYEKSYLDIILKNISKYYKNNLYKVNYDIYLALKAFKTVGVELSASDFIFGKEGNEYMMVFFEENDINSDKLKESFNKLYWKSPDFILYICINFKHLYYKNIKKFSKYYSSKKQEIYDGEIDGYIKEYKEKVREKDEYINNNTRLIQENFINEVYDIKDFSDVKISSLKKDLIIDENYKDDENFINLGYTLNEYQNFIKYKYIFDEAIRIFKEKIGKKEVKNSLRKISKKEKKIYKLNRKINFNKKFKKNNTSQKHYIKINELLSELNEDYSFLEDIRFKDTIVTKLSESSTYLDALTIVNSYKNSLVNIIKEKDDDTLTLEKLNEVEDFVYNPYNTIINNVLLLEEKDILEIILDKYKLMNIKIEEDNIKTNLESFIKVIETINIYNSLKSNNIFYEDLLFLVEAKKYKE